MFSHCSKKAVFFDLFIYGFETADWLCASSVALVLQMWVQPLSRCYFKVDGNSLEQLNGVRMIYVYLLSPAVTLLLILFMIADTFI